MLSRPPPSALLPLHRLRTGVASRQGSISIARNLEICEIREGRATSPGHQLSTPRPSTALSCVRCTGYIARVHRGRAPPESANASKATGACCLSLLRAGLLGADLEMTGSFPRGLVKTCRRASACSTKTVRRRRLRGKRSAHRMASFIFRRVSSHSHPTT